MTNTAVRLNFNKATDIHLNLLAEITFDAAFLLDRVTKLVHFVFGQVADFFRMVDTGLFREPLRAHLADAIDRREADPQTLLHRKINTCDTCHDSESP